MAKNARQTASRMLDMMVRFSIRLSFPTVVPGEAEQSPRAAVSDRDGEDVGVLRGGGAAKEGEGGSVQGQVLCRVQLSWVPGAEWSSKVRTLIQRPK